MLRKLKKCLSDDVFDIILYGSSVKGKHKPADIDILVIFRRGTLRERLNAIQDIKKKLGIDADYKQILIEDLFSDSFFARTGVLLEGLSARQQKPLSQILGFYACTLFWYTLENFTHTQKVKFNYVLAGRNKKGLIEEFEGFRLASGVVKIPISKSFEFEEVLKSHSVKYLKKNILEESHL